MTPFLTIGGQIQNGFRAFYYADGFGIGTFGRGVIISIGHPEKGLGASSVPIWSFPGLREAFMMEPDAFPERTAASSTAGGRSHQG